MTMIGMPVFAAVEPFVSIYLPQKINGKTEQDESSATLAGLSFFGSLPFELLNARRVAKMNPMKTRVYFLNPVPHQT